MGDAWEPPQVATSDIPKLDDTDNPLIADALDNTAFNAAEFNHDWLIEGMLVKNEPGVMGAASKTMKTAIAVDAAVSLASATPFLGAFPVRQATPVYIISAESGAASLQARMRQVCKAKHIDPDGLPIQWYTRVELLSTVEGCRNLGDALKHFGSQVVILDPSYLLLGGEVTSDSAGNMFAMGRLLANVGAACTAAGATVIVVTHANGRVPVGQPMELSHIAWSGFQQWARQWWLLSRIEEYHDDGKHALYFRYGGSAGHTGLLAVGIDEGTLATGRKWDVRAIDAREARKAEQAEKAAEEAAEDQRQLQADCDMVLQAMLTILADGNQVASRNALKKETGLAPPRINKAIEKMTADGAIVQADGLVVCGHGTKPSRGIRRPDSWTR